MNRIHQLREQIDACRPGSDDLELPELAGLARTADEDRAVADEMVRSQRFDKAVGASLHDVPVPAGLLDRLLAATSAAASAAGEAATPASGMVALPEKSSKSSWLSRRALVAGLSAAAILLVAVGLLMVPPSSPRTVSKADLENDLQQWIDKAKDQQGWATTTPPAALPFDARVVKPPQQRWLRMNNSMIAYDCDPTGQRLVTLFVVSTPSNYQVGALPYTLLTTTSGKVAGAWQRGKLLYVLVVHGTVHELDRAVSKPATG